MRFRVLALAVAAGVLLLLIGEGVARLLLDAPRYHSEPLELDSELGFRGVPGFGDTLDDSRGPYAVSLDSHGLRGVGLSDSRVANGALRVVFLGDSFLFSLDVRDEDLMTSRTAVALAEREIDIEVANLSASDYGTGQQLLLLERLGRQLRPDVVVLVLYPGNDLINNSLALAGASTVSVGDYIRPYLVEESGQLRVRWTHPVRAWLRRHSRLFAVAERHLLAIGAEHRIDWLVPWPPAPGVDERLQAGAAPREHFEIFRPPAPGSVWEGAWRDTFALLRAFRDEVQALGARFLVLVIPTVDQVQPNAKGVALDLAIRRARGVPLSDLLDWNLPEERFAAFFEAEGIDARMLRTPLRAAARSGVEVYARDGHLTPAGHGIAAETLEDWLLGEDSGASEDRVEAEPIVRYPDSAAGPSSLDFRHHEHSRHVGDGWIGWRPETGPDVGGWELGRRGLLVLPDRAGELVVRGVIAPTVTLPVELNLEVVWGPQSRVQLDRAGPFEVRLAARRTNPPGMGEQVVVVIGQRGELERGIVVQEVGYEALSAGD